MLILIENILNGESRQLEIIDLYTDDKRCNQMGNCFNMVYAKRNVLVRFNHKPQIRFTSNTTYQVKERKKLSFMSFHKSKFTNFPLQLFEAFDMMELDFRNCSLKFLQKKSFQNACHLEILLLSNNLLTKIQAKQFSKAKNLSYLALDNNRLKDLHVQSFKGLKKLNSLDLQHNLIETLHQDIFSYMIRLQQINLAGNHLKLIEQNLFTFNPQLVNIQLQENLLQDIEDYAFQNQENLIYLDFSRNPQIEKFVSTNLKVEYLVAQNCGLKRVNIYGKVFNLDFQHNAIKELYFSQPELLESLILKDNDLEQISILAYAKNLIFLDVSDNPQLKSLGDLWKIDSLEYLNASNITLKEMPPHIFSSPHKLKYLNVSFNQLQEINPLIFKSLKKLYEIHIHHNNWNCYNLQMLMDMIIRPWKISYTRDKYETNFPGKYIRGIKCFNREEILLDKYSLEEVNTSPEIFNDHQDQFITEKFIYINLENIENVEDFRGKLKIFVQKYDQTFSLIMEKLHNLDKRLKDFEMFSSNQDFWQRASIIV
ncbi:uncharacterized protein ACRADG_000515 isoform 1-T2 [Cochliomyia hominivorax]